MEMSRLHLLSVNSLIPVALTYGGSIGHHLFSNGRQMVAHLTPFLISVYS